MLKPRFHVTVTRQDAGSATRQGNWLTALLWIVSLGAHLGYDYLVEGSQTGLGTASLLLYLGIAFTIQRLILQARADRMAGAGQQDIGAPTMSL